MLSLSEIQDEFTRALLDPARPVPAFVRGGRSPLGADGFAVYRNNVAVGLVDALAERFPVTRRLTGDEFFRAMARVFSVGSLPRSALMFAYGDEFPRFVADFIPARSVPYLGDVARLELAWSRAYHAAEARPLRPDAIAAMRADALAGSTVTLHPSLSVVRSDAPIASIWAAHQGEDAVRAPETWTPEDVLVVRPDAEVHVRRLVPGVARFLEQVADGAAVAEAVEAALAEAPDFDPGVALLDLLAAGAVIRIGADSNPEGTA